MFEYDKKKKDFISLRHPFTKPKEKFIKSLEKRKKDIITESYDLILRGEEIASGGSRINISEVQVKVFKLFNINLEDQQKYFKYFLNALRFAAAPHQGIGIGIDRLLSVMFKTKGIKEFIAFPKNTDGKCFITGE